MTAAPTQPPTGRTEKFVVATRKSRRLQGERFLPHRTDSVGGQTCRRSHERIVRGRAFDELVFNFRFAPSPTSDESGARAESNVGAEPHLGTLPSFKQIRPQRLIKTLHVQSFMDEGAPKRGAIARPPSAPPTMNLHCTGRCVFGEIFFFQLEFPFHGC